jgi:hydrogenase maturation factor
MAERGGCGLEADLKAIPIRQETIEVCEFLGVNPYLLTSAGSALIACDDAEALLQKLSERGINAAVIGHLKEGHEKVLRNDDEMRFLDMPQADELVRIMS